MHSIPHKRQEFRERISRIPDDLSQCVNLYFRSLLRSIFSNRRYHMKNSRVTLTATDEQQRILNERWEEAGIGNDYIFSRVMRNEDTFLKLMQRIFPELKLTKVKRHGSQMVFDGPHGSKSVRFDVYSEIDDRVFDVEMQMENRKNEPRRTRYYQCMMDEQELHKGADYAELPESYIVMISPMDLFEKGRHIYRFRNYEQTDRELELRDGTTKVFLNTNGTDDDILPELKNFLDLVNGAAPADEFCREVSEQVLKAKQSAETRRNFMEFEYKQMLAKKDAREAGWKEGHEEGEKKGLAEGEKKGRNEERLDNYGSLVRDGILSLPDAMKRSGLSEEEIRAWIRQNSAS